MNDNNAPIGEDWWTDEQRDLVQDISSVWTKKRFTTIPGYWISVDQGRMLRKLQNEEKEPEGAALDEAAWDHEHCALCWQKISENPADQQEGYRDGDDWLCVECYNKYIRGQENT